MKKKTTVGRTALAAVTALAALAATTSLALAPAAEAAGGQAEPAGVSPSSPAAGTTTSWAQLSRGAASQGGTVHYAVPRHLCARPAAGQVRCDAVQLVPATEATPGAKAYVEPATTSGPAGGYSPANLAAAYGYDRKASVHQTVAVVDGYDDPHALADLNRYDAHYGLPAETSRSFRKVNQAGHSSPLPPASLGWSGEIALDIEAVRAVCNTCRILLVEATTPSAANLATAVDTAVRLGATEVSNSYGSPESSREPASIAKAYNHPGVVITAASGDDGWYDWDDANYGSQGASDNAPNVPAAYPSVVAVGGTALSLNTDGSRKNETVWNENGPDDKVGFNGRFRGARGASGGGCSHLYAAPAWQAAAAGYSKTGCGTKRLATDVSVVADPYTGFDVYDSYGSGGWVTAGGTSLSSPMVAAMWALAGGAHGVDYPAQTLYDNLQYRSSSVFDVIAGGNSFCGGDTQAGCSAALKAETSPSTGNPNGLGNGNSFYSGGWAGLLDCAFPYDGSTGTKTNITQCNAAPGYDTAGVGTPQGLSLFSPTRPTVTLQGPSRPLMRTEQTWTAAKFADPLGATATRYQWSWGDGTTSSTGTVPTTTHTYTAAGTHRVAVTVTDSLGQHNTIRTSLTLGVRPTPVITGSTTLARGAMGRWWSSKSVEPNTGGRILTRTWELDGHTVATGPTWGRAFARPGQHRLTLVLTDNSGLRATKSVTVTVTR